MTLFTQIMFQSYIRWFSVRFSHWQLRQLSLVYAIFNLLCLLMQCPFFLPLLVQKITNNCMSNRLRNCMSIASASQPLVSACNYPQNHTQKCAIAYIILTEPWVVIKRDSAQFYYTSFHSRNNITVMKLYRDHFLNMYTDTPSALAIAQPSFSCYAVQYSSIIREFQLASAEAYHSSTSFYSLTLQLCCYAKRTVQLLIFWGYKKVFVCT